MSFDKEFGELRKLLEDEGDIVDNSYFEVNHDYNDFKGYLFVVAQTHAGECWAIVKSNESYEKLNSKKELEGIDSSGKKVVVKLSGLIHVMSISRIFYYYVEEYSVETQGEYNNDGSNRYSLSNLAVKDRGKVNFVIDGQEIAYIEFKNKFNAKNRLNLSQLVIHNKNIPSGWTIDNIAGWICDLLSLALGRMIVIHHKSSGQKETWQSLMIASNPFTTFTEEGKYFNGGFGGGLSQELNAIGFVTQILELIFKNQESEANYRFYMDIVYSYIYYSAVVKDENKRSVLLCALGEPVIDFWGSTQVLHEEYESKTRKQILDDIESGLRKHLNNIIPQDNGEDVVVCTR